MRIPPSSGSVKRPIAGGFAGPIRIAVGQHRCEGRHGFPYEESDVAERLRRGTTPEEHAEMLHILRELCFRLRRALDEVKFLLSVYGTVRPSAWTATVPTSAVGFARPAMPQETVHQTVAEGWR